MRSTELKLERAYVTLKVKPNIVAVSFTFAVQVCILHCAALHSYIAGYPCGFK